MMKGTHPVIIDVRIDSNQANSTDIFHRFRNYGEELWVLFRGESRIHIDLGLVDTSIECFRFSAANEIMAKRAVKKARALMSEHFLSGSVEIVEP